MMHLRAGWICLCMVLAAVPLAAGQQPKPFLPIGIFLGQIEEGARIFTPVRLLPFSHPESEGHQFPNATRLYGTEYEDLVWLGRLAGYQLQATLLRYPAEPSPAWPYPGFSELPDTSALDTLSCIRTPDAPPLPGLRVVLAIDGEPVGFIVDTRNLSLARRGMQRATSMGLDLTRADFLAALRSALHSVKRGVIVFNR